jgi:hypothetical protein
MATSITSLPLTQFSGIDFNNIISDITNLVQNNPDFNTNWTDFLSSNAGRMITELFAYITDQLATRIDLVSNETFIGTANQNSSILNLLKMVYYKLSLSSSASADITINLQVPATGTITLTSAYTPLSGVLNNIFSLTALDKNGTPKNFEFINYNATTRQFDYMSPVNIVGSSTNPISTTNITAYEGTSKIITFTSPNNINPHFQLPDNNVVANSIRVYLITTVNETTQEQELLQVDNFLNINASNVNQPIPYVINVTDVGTAEIEFASPAVLPDPSRLYPAGQTIEVFYRVGNGTLGNIAVKSINTTKTIVDSFGNSYPVSFANNSAGENGIDAETIEHAKLNGPLVASTSKKTVTVNDYDVVLSSFTNMLMSKTYGSINAPTDFYKYYGINLSPVQVYNYILLNKNYGNVPPSQYNNFQWFNSILQNRFNELYSFNTGSFNIQDSIAGAIIPTFSAIPAYLGSSQTFNNAFTFYISDTYKSEILTSSNNYAINPDLKIKFSSNQVSTTFFNLIDVAENHSVQWINLGTLLNTTLTSSSTASNLSTSPISYDIRINGTDYTIPYYTAGRTSNKYSDIANFINTSLNSTFSGTISDLNDFVIIGAVNATVPYTIQISSTGTTDTFIWQKNGVFSSPISMTTNLVVIDNAFTIKFLNITGHTIGNTWVVLDSNLYFCSYSQNLTNDLWDIEFYNSVGSTSTLSILSGSSNDLLTALYGTSTYPPLIATIPQSSSINGVGFISGNNTESGLGYINGNTVSTDIENCSAEWVASYSVTSGSTVANYGYDISTKNSIGLNIDGRGMITIPLAPSSDYASGDKKLILLSNPSPLTSGYVTGSINIASYKLGIVERINNALSLNSGSYGSNAPSIQWLNIGSGLTNNSSSNTMSPTIINYDITIDGTNYVIPYDGYNGISGTRNSKSYATIANYINTSLNVVHTAGILDDMLFIGQISSSNIYTIKISSAGTPDSFQWKVNSGSYSSSITITGNTQVITNGNDSFSIQFLNTTGHTTSDIWTISSGICFCTWAMNQGSTNWDMKFFATSGSTIVVSQGLTNDLLTAIYGSSSYSVPTSIPAGNYSKFASIATDISGNQYLKLVSPSTGLQSTIQFIVSDFSTNLSTSIEFMNTLGVNYGLTGNTSYLCVGQKKITIVSNPSSQYFGYGIYEHNSISYAPFYPTTIYSHFIASQKDSIILGSVYNNFYVTGVVSVDDTYKTPVNKIYDTNVYTNGIPDVEASDIQLAFTSSPILSNSINAIENTSNKIDIYPMDYMKIPTKDLRSLALGSFSTNDWLILSIDSLSKMYIHLSTISSITDLYNAISSALQNIAGVASNNVINYLEYDNSNSYIIWIKSNAKNPTGNITLYRTPSGGDYGNNHGLSKIFGVPNVNTSTDPTAMLQFSKLYFSDEPLVSFDLTAGADNEAGAIIYHDALPFTYRFIDMNTQLPRDPDYYLSYENNNIVFTGIGTNDITFVSGSITSPYIIQISATGSPDQFEWKTSSGSFSSPFSITSGNFTIVNGKDSFSINFATTTGHTLGSYWTISPLNNYIINKMANNKIPDSEFYISFVNDRTGEVDSDNNEVVLDENTLQTYLNNYRLTSVSNVAMQPLFETFDLAITITYNPNIAISTIQSAISTLLTTNYGVANSNIGASIVQSKIIADMHSISGVVYVNIDYFGKNYTDKTTNQTNAIEARFDEVLVLSENIYDVNLVQTHGLITTYVALIG